MAAAQRPGAEWWFYHIEQGSLDAAIAPLIEKCLERRWRVLVVGHEETLERLDRALWTARDDAFIPHGRGKLKPETQPVLLSPEPVNANGAKVALLLDGADADANQFERIMVVFEGANEAARAKARQQYKAALDGAVTARYFQQERGGWKEFKRPEGSPSPP